MKSLRHLAGEVFVSSVVPFLPEMFLCENSDGEIGLKRRKHGEKCWEKHKEVPE